MYKGFIDELSMIVYQVKELVSDLAFTDETVY